MKLSLTSWSLRAMTLDGAAEVSKALGIGALDLGYFYGPALDKAQVLSEPARVAERVRKLGVDLIQTARGLGYIVEGEPAKAAR